jgi:HlyD family secretion protein
MVRRSIVRLMLVGVLALAAVTYLALRLSPGTTALRRSATPTSRSEPGSPGTGLRLSGTVEAVRARTVMVPRMAGQTVNTLTITRLAAAGTRVAVGDLLVEFDPQEQLQIAADRRAEVVDLDGQIEKKRADQAIAQAKDNADLTQADHDISRARFGTLNNDLIPRVDAEKNTLALEQATATLKQLQETFALKRKAEEADLKILEIQRERSERARQYAEGNSKLMAVRATFAGVVVIKTTWKGSSMGEVQEGDQVRPGLPILDVVDPTVMRVRAKVNQADIGAVAPGQAAKVRFDAYPDMAFDGRVEVVTPVASMSSLSPKVRTFIALVSIQGNDPQLMPDLTASVDLPVRAHAPGGR